MDMIKGNEPINDDGETVLVPRYLLRLVLEQAWSDNSLIDGEFSSTEEDRLEHQKVYAQINELRQAAGISVATVPGKK
ncbi:hypothetical protein C8J32_10432 [Rhizobium sp. PP-CC-3A-592]|nr:hypothetical protein C8J32_10432 [Rhizobium sp. PP-CC-3A-592]